MFTGKANVIGFSIFLSILGVMITVSRKYYLTKIGVHSVTMIDTILTGTIILVMVAVQTTPGQIFQEFKKMNGKDWLICLLTSVGIAISILVGRNLLVHNDLAYLDILDGGVDLIVTAFVAYFFYKEAMTVNKIIGLVLVLVGMAMLH